MLQTLTFLAGGRQIDAKATFFRYESGSAAGADEAIRVRADGNDLGLYYPGDAVELPVSANRWEIVPASAGTTGVVRLGLGRVSSARLVGLVRVVDQGVDKTMAGLQFYGNQSAIPAAGFTALAGLKCGERTTVIKRVAIASPTAGQALLYTATGDPTVAVAFGGAFNSKRTGSAQSLTTTVKAECAAVLPTAAELPGRVNVRSFYLQPNTEVDALQVGSTPIVLLPGQGLYACGFAANRTISLIVDFEELT